LLEIDVMVMVEPVLFTNCSWEAPLSSTPFTVIVVPLLIDSTTVAMTAEAFVINWCPVKISYADTPISIKTAARARPPGSAVRFPENEKREQ
jgi:hypothetical protein